MAWNTKTPHDTQRKEHIVQRVCPTCGSVFWTQLRRQNRYCTYLCSVQRKITRRDYLRDLLYYRKRLCDDCNECPARDKTCEYAEFLREAVREVIREIRKEERRCLRT